MPALPVLSGRKVVRAFEEFGWQVARQRGSHYARRKWQNEDKPSLFLAIVLVGHLRQLSLSATFVGSLCRIPTRPSDSPLLGERVGVRAEFPLPFLFFHPP